MILIDTNLSSVEIENSVRLELFNFQLQPFNYSTIQLLNYSQCSPLALTVASPP